MRAILSDTTAAGRFANAYATPEPATGPRGNIALDHDAAGAVELRRAFGRAAGATLARIERAIVRVVNGLRDARDRRETVRELRRLSPALLADIGIGPEEIEQLVDARLAGLRYGTAMRLSP
jgi:uncharacterized protein YjiS (DUF1127 family)